MADTSPAHKLVAGGAPGELAAAAAMLWLSVLCEGKKEMEGERREAAAPDIEKGGGWLTGSEEDGGFGSLSGCDLNDDSLWGWRKVVSATASCGRRHRERRRCDDLTGGGAERNRAARWRAARTRAVGKQGEWQRLWSSAVGTDTGRSAPLWHGRVAVPPWPANPSAVRGSLPANRWAPHVSAFPILENLKNHFSAQENRYKVRKNL
jgi:hypothetical protein